MALGYLVFSRVFQGNVGSFSANAAEPVNAGEVLFRMLFRSVYIGRR